VAAPRTFVLIDRERSDSQISRLDQNCKTSISLFRLSSPPQRGGRGAQVTPTPHPVASIASICGRRISPPPVDPKAFAIPVDHGGWFDTCGAVKLEAGRRRRAEFGEGVGDARRSLGLAEPCVQLRATGGCEHQTRAGKLERHKTEQQPRRTAGRQVAARFPQAITEWSAKRRSASSAIDWTQRSVMKRSDSTDL
jgi:hypothetical protein